MALRAVPDHPKFSDLKHRLGVKKCVALGCLEAIWHFCGRFTPQGNIGKYPDTAIEAWVEWPGAPGELIDALVKSCWLDEDRQHRLLVHDWKQHADKATKQALTRASLEFCVPTVHTPGAHSAGTEHSVHTVGIQNVVLSALPVPVPVPEPAPVPRFDEFPKTFEAVCKRYPSADVTIVRKIIELSAQAYVSVMNPKIPEPTDTDYAAAVDAASSESSNQNSAALYIRTVPAVMGNWARHGRNGNEPKSRYTKV